MQEATNANTSAEEGKKTDLTLRISMLQKSKNYKALGILGGLSVVHGHCGWGWRGLNDVGAADDLFFEAEAWEAGCFESGLMMDVDDMASSLPCEMLKQLGFPTSE